MILIPGVIISLARAVTKIALPDTPQGLRIGAALYFGVSAVFLALCILGCHVLHTLPIMVHYEKRKGTPLSLLGSNRWPGDYETLSRALLASSKNTDAQNAHSPLRSPSPQNDGPPLLIEIQSRPKKTFSRAASLSAEGRARSPKPKGDASYREVFLKVWPCAIALTLVYTVTISLFPGRYILLVLPHEGVVLLKRESKRTLSQRSGKSESGCRSS